MKRKIFLILGIIGVALFTACKKNDLQPPTPGNPPPVGFEYVVKYEFSADRAADYRLAYKRDTSIIDEIASTMTWTKTVNVSRNSASKTARLSVYPPEAWVGTTNTSNINIKLSIDGVVKKDTSGIIAGYDRTTGITVQINF